MGKAFARAIFVLLFSVHEVSGASILKCWNRTLHWAHRYWNLWKSDYSKYVRNSVGNWLNDASKTQSGFVRKLCRRWESETKETKYIVKKALRTVGK